MVSLELKRNTTWSTALSARHALPLGPGVVDVAVIDEASQCEIPSILPLLYRARRAVIIGDPLQFRPVITLNAQRNAILLRQHQLTDPSELVYDYVQFSIFDCAANAPFKNVSHHLLRDHFRCHQGIAAYCNQTFYDGTLRLLTDPSRLCVPAGRRPGIVWTEVEGEAKPSRPSGATCQEEADAICEQVAALVKEGYVGTVGVISPFRRQAGQSP